jgi:uncharacterized protein (DUF58 family)
MNDASAFADRARRTADALPPLLVEAHRIAATIIMGVHGRKRSGPGETFWQYRPYAFGDSTQRIDWHKSARAERIFIRENEWEAANTLWLWPSPAPTMDYHSHLSKVTKRERAMLLALALGSLALDAHERVAALGSPFAPGHAQGALPKIAGWFLQGQAEQKGFPDSGRLARYAVVALFGDFLEPPETIGRWLTAIAERGVRGHLIQIADPAEETLPWNGRVEFLEVAGPQSLIVGKTENLREAYQARYKAQREAVREIARRLGWTFAVHRTDETPLTCLLQLHGLIGGERGIVKAAS